MSYFLFALTLLFVIFAIFLLRRSAQQKRESGLPLGRVVYSDTENWTRAEKPLFDPLLQLTGKPDYLVEQRGTIIPVEVKSALSPALPHPGHVFQLAVYCLLVERSTGKRPPYGLLRYANRTLQIDYTAQLENQLLDLLAEIRSKERSGELERSHDEKARCQRCGYRSICPQRL
ncbi:MAG: CRISPR-associated protein Cas4 [Anaerolineae bacterium]|nr:CRISPR-associated protein Cas4 [Anaerolineae bacterium]